MLVNILDKEDLESLCKNNSAVVMYGSVRCAPCKVSKPEFEKISQKYPNVKFGYVEHSQVKTKNLKSTPTFVYYWDKNEHAVIGFNEKDMVNKLDIITKR